jgi:hypothetical protein
MRGRATEASAGGSGAGDAALRAEARRQELADDRVHFRDRWRTTGQPRRRSDKKKKK